MKTARELQHDEHQRATRLADRAAEERYLEKKFGGPPRGPTQETNGKIRPHPIENLLSRQVIDAGQARDLSRIQDAFQIITQGGRVRLSNLLRVDSNGSPEDERAYDADILKDYHDWRAEADEYSFRVVIDVAVSGLPLSDIAKRRGVRTEKIKDALLRGLSAYAAVWKRNHPQRLDGGG